MQEPSKKSSQNNAKKNELYKAAPDPLELPLTPGDEFMTTQELMQYLKVSRTKVWELINDTTPPLPSYRVGADHRFLKSEILAWMRTSMRTKGRSKESDTDAK